jgi:hypothetical protein
MTETMTTRTIPCDCYRFPRMHDSLGVCVNHEQHGGKACDRYHSRKSGAAYYVQAEGEEHKPLIYDGPSVNEALAEAERWAQAHNINVTVSNDRGRVFGFFCKHGGMRDSTMSILGCCEFEREQEAERRAEGAIADRYEGTRD